METSIMEINVATLERKDLLEQAFDVIMSLDNKQLKRLMERFGYGERKAV